MFDGFVRVAAVTPEIRVANCRYNREKIDEAVGLAAAAGAKIICLPELCLTAYTCGDLFLQERLLEDARVALVWLVKRSAGRQETVIVGLPFAHRGKLYNVAAVYGNGELLAIIPKTYIPNYGEFYELRHFQPYSPKTGVEYPCLRVLCDDGSVFEEIVAFGTGFLFSCREDPRLIFSVELCEDLWVAQPPSVDCARAGANIIFNLSASNETIGKAAYRRELVKQQSARLLCAYVYADAGFGESSTDLIFAGHNIIAENGRILRESRLFEDGMILSDIDIDGIEHDRRYRNTFMPLPGESMFEGHPGATFSVIGAGDERAFQSSTLLRWVDPHPFVPSSALKREARCEEILLMQSVALAKRLLHTKAKTAVIGISGGLDSTLALLVTARAMERLGRRRDEIVAVTMPAFGTTAQTKGNAQKLCAALGITLREIDITDSTAEHLKTIGHDLAEHNVVFENAQARIRTLVLMDLANKYGGIVIGTGDLSELALGWATYNGDHMSMYGVNAGVPKTLVRHIIDYAAEAEEGLQKVLHDILDTPVSPELLPPDAGGISQKTEEIIGPYELHDFFLYHMIRWGRKPAGILALAVKAFGWEEADREGQNRTEQNRTGSVASYDRATILKWLKVFYRRFFASQFKRSALPDGPKIGSVSLSPRGDWRMPSDAEVQGWLAELDT
jgi:NAD+ synthase (glutamine-hydrolysing)